MNQQLCVPHFPGFSRGPSLIDLSDLKIEKLKFKPNLRERETHTHTYTESNNNTIYNEFRRT